MELFASFFSEKPKSFRIHKGPIGTGIKHKVSPNLQLHHHSAYDFMAKASWWISPFPHTLVVFLTLSPIYPIDFRIKSPYRCSVNPMKSPAADPLDLKGWAWPGLRILLLPLPIWDLAMSLLRGIFHIDNMVWKKRGEMMAVRKKNNMIIENLENKHMPATETTKHELSPQRPNMNFPFKDHTCELLRWESMSRNPRSIGSMIAI